MNVMDKYKRKVSNLCTTAMPVQNNVTQCSPKGVMSPVGGGHSHVFSTSVIMPYLSAAELELDYSKTAFKFISHVNSTSLFLYPEQKGFVHVKMALPLLVLNLTAAMTHQVAKVHKI